MSSSKNIPVRMPLELYQAVIDSKPADVRVSTYLLLLVRRGLNAGVDGLSTNVETSSDFVDTRRDIVDDALLKLLQSRIAGLEAQLEGVQLTIDDAVQKAVDNYTAFVDRRIQEGFTQQMAEVLGECRA